MNKILSKLNEIENPRRRNDAITLLGIIQRNVPDPPRLWADKVVGFGDYHYINKTNEGDMPILAFVPAKAHITLYIAVGGLDPYQEYLDRIGRYRRGKGCLYISNLSKINTDVLEEMIRQYYLDALNGVAKYGHLNN